MEKFAKKFNVRLVVRLTLLLASVTIFASVVGDPRLFFNQVILFVLMVSQIVELIRFMNNTNRELARFFMAIRHDDYAVTFRQTSLGNSFEELHRSMEDVIASYKQIRIEKEAQYHFLQLLVDQLPVGLITLASGEITLINAAAGKLVGTGTGRNWKLIAELNPRLATQIEAIGDDGRKLVEVRNEDGGRFLSVSVSTLRILDRSHKVVTLQDINPEIEQKELEAWHKLIRILTHEIMNSVTPVASLTETMMSLLEDKSGNQKSVSQLHDATIADIRFSLQTIHKRSEGLLQFIDNYRKLTRVPRPKKEKIELESFFSSLERLFAPELLQKAISFSHVITGVQHLDADPALIEQVIINLVSNSTHALNGRPHATIELTASRDERFVVIEVRDNGLGIPDETRGEMFTPFFSTRKEGSGIGLSLSKQIMSLHDGHIRVRSEVNVGTSMLLYFPVFQKP